MADLSFIKSFEKTVEKLENVSGISSPPRYWYSSGNYVLNYILSGNFQNAIPQGRITAMAGPSGSGKSFIQCNVCIDAQKQGAYVLMIDSENSLDDDFTSKIGINVDLDYNYKSVVTIDDTIKLLSSFIQGYRSTYGEAVDAPKVLIVLDSLDMLLTSTEQTNFDKGDIKGDQGQRAKQIKAMLRNIVQQIKNLNISVIVTTHVYGATQEQILKGLADGSWVINGAVKFSLSHLMLLTKLKLKDDSGGFSGIRMKCQPVKTRFTKPFQDVVIDVPYETGMDPYSGLKDVATALGVLEKKGSYNKIVGTDIQFYAKNIAEHADLIFEKIDELDTSNTSLHMTETLNEVEEGHTTSDSSTAKRLQKLMNIDASED